MMSRTWWNGILSLMLTVSSSLAEPRLKALIVDGQCNQYHDWKAITPVLKKTLEDTKLFSVDVSSTPPAGANMEIFKPDFTAYRAVVLNYDGEDWPEATRAAFIQYVRSGGGLVIVHSSDNAFPKWREFNEMIGLGGWGNRNEQSGPYVRLRDGKFVPVNAQGPGGHHGRPHPYVVTTRAPEHPVMAGLPSEWLHVKDELYDSLRGPARNLEVLASAYSDPSSGGTGEHEPILFTIQYGKGRVFHSVMGHGPDEMKCVGFITTLQRGAEWAATGKVTQKVPTDFPASDRTSTRN